MSNIKERYRQFKAWQKQLPTWELKSAETQHCCNCGHDFTGNYCPYCAQAAGAGRITWQSVRQGVMEIWGVGNRSMPQSLLQLLLRPGYFVRDYISGHRQVSFPPVKMLIVVAVIVTLLTRLVESCGLAALDGTSSSDVDGNLVSQFFEWTDRNQGWGMLIISSLFILPTWMLFRYAPAYPRHTLPEGFFLQVFLSTLTVILTFFATLIPITGIIGPVYIVVTYRQLFGYSTWSTIWRTGCCLIFAIMALIIVYFLTSEKARQESLLVDTLMTLLFLILAVLPTLIGHLISRHRYRRRTRQG